MIQPLRTAHFRTFIALAVLLPSILVAGLGARRRNKIASVPLPELPSTARPLQRSNTLWKKYVITTEFYADQAKLDEVLVVLKTPQMLNEPDLLLYITGANPQEERLPSDARLLGTFVPGKSYAITKNSPQTLVLYSLAHRATVDQARIEKLP